VVKNLLGAYSASLTLAELRGKGGKGNRRGGTMGKGEEKGRKWVRKTGKEGRRERRERGKDGKGGWEKEGKTTGVAPLASVFRSASKQDRIAVTLVTRKSRLVFYTYYYCFEDRSSFRLDSDGSPTSFNTSTVSNSRQLTSHSRTLPGLLKTS